MGIATAFLRGAFFSSVTSVTGASVVAEAFLTARLRGVLGSIAMAPNPLCLRLQTVFLKNPVGFSVPSALGLFRD
jgi:hypothetical protein